MLRLITAALFLATASCADTVTYSYLGDHAVDLQYKVGSKDDSKAKCSMERDDQGRITTVMCEVDHD